MVYVAIAKHTITRLKVDPMDLCTVRTGTLGLMSLAIAIKYKKSLYKDVTQNQKNSLIVRGLLGAVGYAALVFSVKYVPILIWTLIYNTSPFWTMIMSYFQLNESIDKYNLICICGCFFGVFILSLSKEEKNPDNKEARISSFHVVFGMFCALLNAVCYSGVIVITKKTKAVHYSLVTMSYSIIATSIYVTFLMVEFIWDKSWDKPMFRIFYYGGEQWWYLSIVAVLNSISMLLFTLAFQKGKSVLMAMMTLINVVYSFIADTLYFNTSYTAFHFIGAFVITGFNIASFYHQLKLEKEKIHLKLEKSFESNLDSEKISLYAQEGPV